MRADVTAWEPREADSGPAQPIYMGGLCLPCMCTYMHAFVLWCSGRGTAIATEGPGLALLSAM